MQMCAKKRRQNIQPHRANPGEGEDKGQTAPEKGHADEYGVKLKESEGA